MRTKKVLVVGMLDSIHLARWLEQFASTDVKFMIFPSTHYRRLHSKLEVLSDEQFKVFGRKLFRGFSGYLDSIITFRLISDRLGKVMRKCLLRFVTSFFDPDIIHAIEIQHAGYLMECRENYRTKNILTNWGSDIYYFQHFKNHREKISRALSWATHYSAECERDYELALDFNFSGVFLPRIPNAGGFSFIEKSTDCSSRELILVKTYGGEFGAGKIAIGAIQEFAKAEPNSRIHFYSVTSDLENSVQEIQKSGYGKITYSTLKEPLSHDELLEMFRNARIYVGCSKSDGLSTSFLEAICSGAYPIQTNTSCAQELIDEGAAGSIVNLDESSVINVLRQVYSDSSRLDLAQVQNYSYARTKLSSQRIENIAQTFYQI